jgi:hypothetical protein
MRLARTVLLAVTLVTVAFPAMAQHRGWGGGGWHGGWGGGGWRGGGWGWRGGWGGWGWRGGWGGWGWRGGWYGFPGFYGAYYAPPPVYPAPAPAVYYAPRPVYHRYHHVVVHHRCSCYCCQ